MPVTNAASVEKGLSGLKILVVDDSKTIRRTAETLLAKQGCEVITAVDGFDALAKIADHKPDLIFVDIMMPRLDGCELSRRLSSERPGIRVLYMSGHGLDTATRRGMVEGSTLIEKPFSLESFGTFFDLRD